MFQGLPHDERKILNLIAQGNELAFTQVFDRFRGKIHTVALRMLKSSTLAEEVVQEVFLKIWMRREKLTEVQNFEGYLFMIARNFIFDYFKKVANEAEASKLFMLYAQAANNTDHKAIENEYMKLLQTIIDQLTPQQKQVYRMAREQFMSHEEIAQALNISRLTVKTHMAQALKFIRTSLQKNIEFYSAIPLLICIFRN